MVWNLPRVRHGDHAASTLPSPGARQSRRPRMVGAASTAMPASFG